MKQRLFTATMLLAATLQVACGGDKGAKTKAQLQALLAQQCGTSMNPAACQNAWTQAANNTGLPSVLGTAAASGQPQVAAATATPTAGQVPSTTLLPASVTDQTIKTQAAAISSQLKSMNTASVQSTPSSSSTNLATASVPTQVAVGVARLPASDEPAGPMVNLTTASVATPPAAASVDNGSEMTSESPTVNAGR